MRRFACRFTTAILLAAALTGCANDADQSADRPPDQVVYLTSFGNFGRDAYAWVALAKGFFADCNINVEIRAGTGTDGIKLVATGKAHFVASDFSGTLMQVSQNKLDVRAVALIHQRSLAAIMALQSDGIRRPKDLEGATIADLPSSVVRMLFPTYATAAGINPKKVRFINATPQTLPSLLGTGTTDAIGQFVVGKPTIEAATKQPVALLPYSDHLIDLPGNALWAAGTTNPDLIRRFRHALLDGLRYALAHPDEAGQILAKNIPGTNPTTAAAELELMRPYVGNEPIGAIDPPRIARAIALLQSAGAIPPGTTPEQLIDERTQP
ncbi:MAG TPA: ABC transporter substrate-binding protein [Micromonospora sp.]|nr:ABC transporter substrate-binding protein [Micromonospora sp.]